MRVLRTFIEASHRKISPLPNIDPSCSRAANTRKPFFPDTFRYAKPSATLGLRSPRAESGSRSFSSAKPYPQTMPIIPGFSLGTRSSACYPVGGDYLDVVAEPDGSHLMANGIVMSEENAPRWRVGSFSRQRLSRGLRVIAASATHRGRPYLSKLSER